MADPSKQIETRALRLPQKRRAELAKVLLLSLESEEPEDNEALWAEEAERRYQELKSGAVKAVDSETVLQEARSRLR